MSVRFELNGRSLTLAQRMRLGDPNEAPFPHQPPVSTGPSSLVADFTAVPQSARKPSLEELDQLQEKGGWRS